MNILDKIPEAIDQFFFTVTGNSRYNDSLGIYTVTSASPVNYQGSISFYAYLGAEDSLIIVSPVSMVESYSSSFFYYSLLYMQNRWGPGKFVLREPNEDNSLEKYIEYSVVLNISNINDIDKALHRCVNDLLRSTSGALVEAQKEGIPVYNPADIQYYFSAILVKN